MGTNPIAFAFPSEDDPLVFDIGTSATTWGDVILARTKAEPLPGGVAVDAEGRATVDPTAALDGAFLAWGGQRGSALALAVQALGVLAGSAAVIRETGDFGLFFLVIDPERLLPGGQCRARMSELRRSIAANRPLLGQAAVRVPGDGSQQRRRQALTAGTVSIDERVHKRIQELCG
jgi:LDH2 family malate/lactate/ureidoglycolate dehydrogenase